MQATKKQNQMLDALDMRIKKLRARLRIRKTRDDAWSPEARKAALEARRAKSQGGGVARLSTGLKSDDPILGRKANPAAWHAQVKQHGYSGVTEKQGNDAWSPEARAAALEARRQGGSTREARTRQDLARFIKQHPKNRRGEVASKFPASSRYIPPLLSSEDAGTSEGARKAAQTRDAWSEEARAKALEARRRHKGLMNRAHKAGAIETNVRTGESRPTREFIEKEREARARKDYGNDAGTSEGARKAAQTRKANHGFPNRSREEVTVNRAPSKAFLAARKETHKRKSEGTQLSAEQVKHERVRLGLDSLERRVRSLTLDALERRLARAQDAADFLPVNDAFGITTRSEGGSGPTLPHVSLPGKVGRSINQFAGNIGAKADQAAESALHVSLGGANSAKPAASSDAGTSEGARKAAETRKAHGGGAMSAEEVRRRAALHNPDVGHRSSKELEARKAIQQGRIVRNKLKAQRRGGIY
jgi:hypothetical protein